jgi:ABC-type Zn uptake system ZnuABC Zn-binding protein ZnuA
MKNSILVISIILLILPGYSTQVPADRAVRVTVSIEGLAYFVYEIGGPYVDVHYLAAEEEEFHEIVISNSMIQEALNSDILIVTGHIAWERDLISIVSEVKPSNESAYIVNLLEDLKDELLILRFPHSDELNLHGYWLYTSNAIIIASKIAEVLSIADPPHSEYYSHALLEFGERLTRLEELMYDVREKMGVEEESIVAVTPPEQYVLKSFGLNPSTVLVRGGLQDISPSIYRDFRDGLNSGKYKIIVISDLTKKKPIYRLVQQLSQEYDVRVIEFRASSLNDIYLYETLMTYNIAALSSLTNPSRSVERYDITESTYTLLIIVSVLVLISLSLYIIFRVRRG